MTFGEVISSFDAYGNSAAQRRSYMMFAPQNGVPDPNCTISAKVAPARAAGLGQSRSSRMPPSFGLSLHAGRRVRSLPSTPRGFRLRPCWPEHGAVDADGGPWRGIGIGLGAAESWDLSLGGADVPGRSRLPHSAEDATEPLAIVGPASRARGLGPTGAALGSQPTAGPSGAGAGSRLGTSPKRSSPEAPIRSHLGIARPKDKTEDPRTTSFLRLNNFLLRTHITSLVSALAEDGWLEAHEREQLIRVARDDASPSFSAFLRIYSLFVETDDVMSFVAGLKAQIE